jgi:hypothetical protein
MRPAWLAAGALALVACARPPAAPVLDDRWPTTTPRYEAAAATWTRSGELRGDYQLVASVDATLKSPAWRQAWVQRRASVMRMSPAARDALLEAQRQAHAEAWEVQLVLTTWDRRENDLDRGARSVWRVTLVDDAGNEFEPLAIERDRRPEFTIRAEYPGHGDFARTYVVKFPRTAAALGPGVARVGLRLSSPRGAIDLWWRAADGG